MKGICRVILRVISILIFLKGFSYIHGIVLYFFTKSPINSSIITIDIVFLIIQLSAVIILGILVWVFSDKISTRMVADLKSEVELSTDTLLRTAIIIIGVIMLAQTVPSLIGNLYEYISVQTTIKNQMAPYNGFLQVKADIITDSLKSVVAFFMVVGYRSIMKLSYMLSVEKVDDHSNEDD